MQTFEHVSVSFATHPGWVCYACYILHNLSLTLIQPTCPATLCMLSYLVLSFSVAISPSATMGAYGRRQGDKVALVDDTAVGVTQARKHPKSAILLLTIDANIVRPAVEKVIRCKWFLDNPEIKIVVLHEQETSPQPQDVFGWHLGKPQHTELNDRLVFHNVKEDFHAVPPRWKRTTSKSCNNLCHQRESFDQNRRDMIWGMWGLGYRKMCHFFSTKVFKNPVVRQFKYYMRVDTDGLYRCKNNSDDINPFLKMEDAKSVYGYFQYLWDPDDGESTSCLISGKERHFFFMAVVTTGLSKFVRDYARTNNIDSKKRFNFSWDRAIKLGEEQAPLFYNNLEMVGKNLLEIMFLLLLKLLCH